jgi:cell division septum initiation protein DivIVA
VALDRDSIQKQDFPVGDGGYDRDAVDGHLRALADQVEELQRSSTARSQSLADTASDRIRAIVEGAETSAVEIQRHAAEDADRIRADAGNDAAAIRQQAKDQAHADVGKVNESTAEMMSRLEAMKGELNALFESLRTGSERLKSELDQLEGHMGQVREATGAPEPGVGHPSDAHASEQADPIAPEEHSELVEEGALHAAAPAPPEKPAEPQTPSEPHSPSEPQTPAEPDDAEGARLIALNMALNGTPREETDRYLAEHYKLNDRGGLLDEVYASVEG